MSEYGKYFIVSIGDHLRQEVTNIGVILYSKEGQQLAAKMDSLERATKRGDFTPDETDDTFQNYVDTYATFLPTLESVERRMDSTGHCMSSIQIRPGGGTLLGNDPQENVERIFNRLVK